MLCMCVVFSTAVCYLGAPHQYQETRYHSGNTDFTALPGRTQTQSCRAHIAVNYTELSRHTEHLFKQQDCTINSTPTHCAV